MARKDKSVDALRHKDKRLNIPTAELEPVMRDEEKTPIRLAYERRNRDLDPQLVWRGKDEQDWSDLIVQAPPLYIQEKIHPKVLVDDLLRQSRERRDEANPPMPDLFADFNGLPDKAARTEFYQHDANWSNRMILGDSLSVMASLAEREGLRGKVQCIYIDPPYGIRFNSNFQWSTTTRDVKDNDKSHVTREPEQVKAFRDTWRDGIHSYLTYLRDRLTVARDLLADSGSIFVQIGDENIHRVRALMDEVFGEDNIVSLICLRKTGGQETSILPNVSDYILWYAKKLDHLKYRQLYYRKEVGVGEGSGQRYDRLCFEDGTRRSLTREERDGEVQIAVSARAYQLTSLISSGVRTNTTTAWRYAGKEYHSGLTSNWKTSLTGLENLAKASRIESRKTTLAYVRYIDDFAAYPVSNMWTDVAGAAGIIYVVQTSATIVQRCLLMATDPGDLVLDPTCGSGTTAYVAEQWAHESNDFTPWLAEPENLSLLADTLNLGPLQLQGTEVPVGNFFIDILARKDDGGIVVIENQYGLTDHTHLGQLLTYLAGQEGRATVIWIAETFREEHRATIDWLNANTIPGFDFFAVEVEALKIGDSLPAPWFNVICKPNDWSRDVVRVTRSTENGPLDERAKAYVNYWSGFAAFLRDRRAAFKLNTPRREYLCGFGNIGVSGFHLNATAGFRDRKIRVEIYIAHPAAKRAFDLLQGDQEAIEKEFGAPLDWLRLDDKKGCCIAVSRTNADPNIEAQRPNQYEWLLDQMERFSRVFRDRIRALPLDNLAEADLASGSIEAEGD